MAVLSESDRAALWREAMENWSSSRTPITISKSDLRAAVDALDDFFNSNAAAINNALPAAAKAGLTTAQKAEVLMWVTQKRYIKGA